MMLEGKILLNNHSIIWINLFPISVYQSIARVEISFKIISGLLDQFMLLLLFLFLLLSFLISFFFLLSTLIKNVFLLILLFSQSKVFDLFLGLLLLWFWLG